MIHITKHAYLRGKQRLGLSKKAIRRMAEKAYAQGGRHGDFTGGFLAYLNVMYMKYKKANNIRIYGHHIYIFCHEDLITIMEVPVEFRRTVTNVMRGRQAALAEWMAADAPVNESAAKLVSIEGGKP